MSERKAQILMASVIIARSTAYLFSKTLLQTMDRFTVLANRFLLLCILFFPPHDQDRSADPASGHDPRHGVLHRHVL